MGGGVFMGWVGRGDACVHAVWGGGGVWVCVWCVPAGGAGRDRETQPGAKEDAVCVCVWVCTWGVWCAGGRRQRNVHGWISRIIRLCFLSAFITSAIQTTPVRDR